MSNNNDLRRDRKQAGTPGGDVRDSAPPVECPPLELVARTGPSAPGPAAVRRREAVVSDLDPAEQVVVWILRQWLSGETGECLVRQELFNLCRLTGIEAAIQGLERLIDTLGHSGRRVMTLHCCQCREVSHDERLLLFLVAAAQRPDTRLVRALACWLVPAAWAETLIEAARDLGLALSRGGHRLPLELPPRPLPKSG